jgi:predicted nuclease with TOPRIM domain
VDQAVAQVGELRNRARTAEARNGELEALLARFDSGEEDPGAYVERLKALEKENTDLRGRIEQGRDAAERLLARIRFLEEQR